MNIKAYVLAARPVTLIAAIIPVLLGTKLGIIQTGVLDLLLFVCCLFSALAIQVATNFFNDALDFKHGADKLDRQGPKRMVASGLIHERNMRKAAILMQLIAIVFAVPLVITRGWPILAIGLPSLYCAYAYTGAPLKLAYRGLGEIFVIVFFGLIAVTGSAFVQSGSFQTEALLLGLQSGLLATVLISINNLRDIEEDRLSSKKTLAVCFGKVFAKVLISIYLLAPFVIDGRAGFTQLPLAIQASGLLATATAISIWLSRDSGHQKHLFLGAVIYVMFALGHLV